MFNRILRYFSKKHTHNDDFLFTLGYEGLKQDSFISHLKENNIETLVDVREVPWSRKRGFSKSQLENSLTESGIRYVHMKSLGSPSYLRKKVKENADYEYFFKEYTNYIETRKMN